MASTWSLPRKLLASGLIFLALVIAAGAVAVWAAWSMRTGQAETATAARRMRLASQVQAANHGMFAAEKAMIVAGAAGDADAMATWHAQANTLITSSAAQVKELHRLAATEGDRQAVVRLQDGLTAWEGGCASCHDETASMGDPATMQRLSAKTRALVESNAALAQEIEARQASLFVSYSARARARAVRTLEVVMAILVIAVVTGCGIGWVVRRATGDLHGVSAGLTQGVEQTFAAAAQSAASAHALSRAATQQATSLEETSAAIEEMSSMTRQNASASEQAARLFGNAASLAGRANDALDELLTSMNSIAEASEKVSRIIKTVDEIAFQTNILALNAAVEAARAGEAGMGFAVVADEVRSLAQRSAQAARDTASLIEASLGASRGGRARVDQMSEAIRAITETISTVKGLVDQVSTASVQQAQGLTQVSQAMLDIERATQATAASAEEGAAASEELNAQAKCTWSHVERLDGLVGGALPTARRVASPQAPAAWRHTAGTAGNPAADRGLPLAS